VKEKATDSDSAKVRGSDLATDLDLVKEMETDLVTAKVKGSVLESGSH
jgi:hypothetical protein